MKENERVLILGAVLKRIENFDMNSFEGRLILQKTIYLLQAFHLSLGYHFSWYIYGPYSTELASDGFQLAQLHENVPKGRFSKKESEQRFEQFLAFLGESKRDADWLELVASIHFLTQLYPHIEKSQILGIIKKKQHYFPIEECERAWKYLEKANLLGKKN